MNEETPELTVWCSDCEVILYSAIVNWITNHVAQTTAEGHAAQLGHEVLVFERKYTQ